MSSLHLDQDTYRCLRSGEINPVVAQQMAEHLASHCEICEAFLASLPSDDFDGQVDALLTSIAANHSQYAGNDLEFARIERALARKAPAYRAKTGTKLLATAALALVVVTCFLLLHTNKPDDRAWDGVKGIEEPIATHLRFAVVTGNGHQAQLVRKKSGAVLSRDDHLVFRVQVEHPAYVALVRVGSGKSELIWKQHIHKPGTFDIGWKDGRAAAYPLLGLAGDQQFVLIAGKQQLSDADFSNAAISLCQSGHPMLKAGGNVISVKVR